MLTARTRRPTGSTGGSSRGPPRPGAPGAAPARPARAATAAERRGAGEIHAAAGRALHAIPRTSAAPPDPTHRPAPPRSRQTPS